MRCIHSKGKRSNNAAPQAISTYEFNAMKHAKPEQKQYPARSNASQTTKKPYRTPKLQRLGDFHSMTRTGTLIPFQNDMIDGVHYIS